MLTFSTVALADEVVDSSGDVKLGVWDFAKQQVTNTWSSRDYELYIPINTWHNRDTYTAEDIRNFNEQPWG
jgi:palmitoyl transferase